MDVDIQVQHRSDRELVFEVGGLELPLVNGMRRAVLADVPLPAVRFDPTTGDNPDITFLANTTGLHNELLGQRISLTPIHFSAQQVDTFSRDAYRFVLRVDRPGDVTTDDVKVLSARGVVQPAELHRQLFPRDPVTGEGVLLTRLKEGEELHVEAHATMGTAREYGAAFCPTCVCSFGAAVDEALAAEALAEKEAALVASHAERGLPPPTERELAALHADFAALDRQRCFRRDRWGEPTRFVFRMESTCGLGCLDILLRALNALAQRLGAIAAGAPDARARRAGENGFSITVAGADHADGNILQSYMYDTHVEGDRTLAFVGYHVPHPLEDSINLRLVFSEGNAARATEEGALELLRASAEAAGNRVRAVRAAFERALLPM